MSGNIHVFVLEAPIISSHPSLPTAWPAATAAAVAAGDTVLVDGRIVGTAQPRARYAAQPAASRLSKMPVHRSARCRGSGARLMTAIEQEAKRRGRWILVLDTVPGESGYRLDRCAGWTRAASCKTMGCLPMAGFATSVFLERLDG